MKQAMQGSKKEPRSSSHHHSAADARTQMSKHQQNTLAWHARVRAQCACTARHTSEARSWSRTALALSSQRWLLAGR
jgi:hypothetical protein